MEVCVIKPASMEDTREIADTLLAGCTVVLNLEGIDVDIAQRIIDFCCGACYCMSGSLQLYFHPDTVQRRNFRRHPGYLKRSF